MSSPESERRASKQSSTDGQRASSPVSVSGRIFFDHVVLSQSHCRRQRCAPWRSSRRPCAVWILLYGSRPEPNPELLQKFTSQTQLMSRSLGLNVAFLGVLSLHNSCISRSTLSDGNDLVGLHVCNLFRLCIYMTSEKCLNFETRFILVFETLLVFEALLVFETAFYLF